MDRAAELIRKAKRPVILAGHGITLSGAYNEVREFADSYNSVSCLVSASHAGRAVSALSAEFGVALQAPSSEDPW